MLAECGSILSSMTSRFPHRVGTGAGRKLIPQVRRLRLGTTRSLWRPRRERSHAASRSPIPVALGVGALARVRLAVRVKKYRVLPPTAVGRPWNLSLKRRRVVFLPSGNVVQVARRRTLSTSLRLCSRFSFSALLTPSGVPLWDEAGCMLMYTSQCDFCSEYLLMR